MACGSRFYDERAHFALSGNSRSVLFLTFFFLVYGFFLCSRDIYNKLLFFPLQQNSVIFIILFYLLLTPDVAAANPINQKDKFKAQLVSIHQNGPTSKVSPTSPKNFTKLKSFPIMTNGAFGSVNMINQNAIAHKFNKKIDDKKKKVDIAKVKRIKPTNFPLCFPKPASTVASTSVSGPKVNTLFTSQNWGH